MFFPKKLVFLTTFVKKWAPKSVKNRQFWVSKLVILGKNWPSLPDSSYRFIKLYWARVLSRLSRRFWLLWGRPYRTDEPQFLFWWIFSSKNAWFGVEIVKNGVNFLRHFGHFRHFSSILVNFTFFRHFYTLLQYTTPTRGGFPHSSNSGRALLDVACILKICMMTVYLFFCHANYMISPDF